jgi:hypothetical protein
VTKVFAFLGLATSAIGVVVLQRAQQIANEEGRPLADVLMEMPARLVHDLGTFGDDLREAVEEGRVAAEQATEEFDEELGETPPRSNGL